VAFAADLGLDQLAGKNAPAPDYRTLLAELDAVPDPEVAAFESWQKLAAEYHAASSLDVPPALLAELPGSDARPESAQTETDVPSRIAALRQSLASRSTIRLPHCLAPYTVMYVQGDGSVRPCCVLNRHCGNLSTASAREVWHSAAYAQLRRSLASSQDMPAPCAGCQDGTRFALARELFEEARELGIDLKKLELPDPESTPPALVEWLRAAGARAERDQG
jgi:hypothetical protein